MSLSAVKHILVVLSGKGGVGKSSVTTQLALSLCLAGYAVGVLDVDLTGPSMPRMLGVEGHPVTQSAAGWVPVTVHAADLKAGIGPLKLMSLGFLLGSRGDAVVWRGPKKTAMVRQFLAEVAWGPIDFLVIDTPPGTSDEHIALAETLLADAQPQQARAVVVTTPQPVATADVRKELNFCIKVGLPVLGVIENMSGFVCANCAECSDLFGAGDDGGGRVLAVEFGVPFLGAVPIDPQFGMLIESGRLPVYAAATPEQAQQQQPRPEPLEEYALALVLKYRACSLEPVFRQITNRIRLDLDKAQLAAPPDQPSAAQYEQERYGRIIDKEHNF